MNDPARVRLSGPLVAYAEGFAALLRERGYRPRTVAGHLRLMAYLSRCLQSEGLAASSLDAATVDVLLARRRAAGFSAGVVRSSLAPMLEYLRAVGVVPAAEPVAASSAVETMLARYAEYLARERGLAKKTIDRNIGVARGFLVSGQRGGKVELETLTAGGVTAFVVELSRRRPSSVPCAAMVLRSLLRFLHVDGVVEAGLADAIPSVAHRKLVGLPKALTSEQVAALLASCDQATVVGRRDLAILTMLSRLGLRASEVARLRLDDVDWRQGEITVAGKGSRHDRLPLPDDVGTVLVSYLTDSRPDTTMRELFLCVRAPHRAMGRAGVTQPRSPGGA